MVWSGTLIAGGGLSTFYFDDAFGTAAGDISAVASFFSTTEAMRTNTCVWTTNADVATIDSSSGALISVTSTAQQTGVGTAAGDPLPPTQQGLLRALTSTVVAGRVLRGRLFLPGTPETQSGSTGQPIAGYLTAYNNAAAALNAGAASVWSIWSPTHGVQAAVFSANMWTKFAVLRSRRD